LSHFHDDEPRLAYWLILSDIVQIDSDGWKTTTSQVRHPQIPQHIPAVPSIKGFVCALPGRVKYLQALISGWYVYMLCNNHFFHGSNGYGSIPMGPSASGDIQFLDVFGCSWR